MTQRIARWLRVAALCVAAACGAHGSTPLRADPPADPLAQALAWLADPDAEVHGRAFDVLLRRAPPERLAGQPGRTTPAVEHRLHGVRYLIRGADRLRATAPGSVERFLALEEVFGSAWDGHVPAFLVRAGLRADEADALLAQRAQARLAFDTYLELAQRDAGTRPAAALLEARKAGAALVPHLLVPLAVPSWLATQGWPGGPFVIGQRCCCWALKALSVHQAIPFLFMQLESPSSLAWDALDTLHTLTQDPLFAGQGLATPEQVAHRAAWWKQVTTAQADVGRQASIMALRHALSWMISRRGDPQHWTRSEVGGSPRDPLVMLFQDVRLLTGMDVKGLPPPVLELGATDVPAWLPHVTKALRTLEER
jgi:hypothetical protein